MRRLQSRVFCNSCKFVKRERDDYTLTKYNTCTHPDNMLVNITADSEECIPQNTEGINCRNDCKRYESCPNALIRLLRKIQNCVNCVFGVQSK